MSDTPPPEQPEENLAREFRALGQNLVDALRAAWESPERKRLQTDIENGLNELGQTIRQEVDTFRESPTGQRIQTDVGEMKERVRSGEAEAKVRSELLSALQAVNDELQKAAAKLRKRADEPGSPPPPAGDSAADSPAMEESPPPEI